MTVLVCSDLDRTLIYSTAAFHLDGPDEAMPRLLCVEFYRGAPLSYLTETAARTLETLAEAATFVPTTTRTPEQYRRVRLLEKPPPYAICANGGRLLVDGEDDPEWAASVRRRVSAECAPLAEVERRLADVSGDFVLKRRSASGLFAYTVVDRAALPSGWADDLAGWCAERGWRTSLQGRKVYCLPTGLTKAAAAAEVARRAGASRTLAAGDSLLDAELLEAADAAIRPAHGELHDSGWTSPVTSVTAARGIAAGQEIARWLLERAAAA
ncbi:HAD family hydrolase [Actinomadura chibensis]|uniref:HAD family hydrolase n=1 Tax=Actinomadura chibensis TaxID=392828 RepID=A0A5D0NGL4_9ACTN|nr:HAD family hydrolase [Actinomadura chibensis]TYB43547.1 HAD family hydrolase [Actinomadura chibensis]